MHLIKLYQILRCNCFPCQPGDVIKWKHFRVTGLCEGNPPLTGGFPSQRPVTRSFAVFFDLRLNKRLSKSRHRWFETPSPSFWRHCNESREGVGRGMSPSSTSIFAFVWIISFYIHYSFMLNLTHSMNENRVGGWGVWRDDMISYLYYIICTDTYQCPLLSECFPPMLPRFGLSTHIYIEELDHSWPFVGGMH